MCEEGKRAEACVCLLVVVLVDRIVENGAQRKAPSRESFWFQASCLPGQGGSAPLGHTFHSPACITWLGRVWGRDGKLEHSLANHEGAIFALKWNPSVSRRDG